MPAYRILGDQLISNGEFISRLASRRGGLESADDFAQSKLRKAFAPAGLEASSSAATQFVPIGLGRPLTILIREVYTGRFPVKGLFSGAKPMAIVTGLKDYSVFAAASRAVNFLERNIAPRTRFRAPSTFADGTNVVAYSPAVLTDSFHFTVEMAFDNFDAELFDKISKGLTAAAGIPLLMPAAGYLLAASGLIKVGAEWADGLIDGNAAFSVTDSLDFNLPGTVPPSADFRVLCRFDAAGLRYDPSRGLLDTDGRVYDGDEPYVIVSLDGAERKNLEAFAPSLATAAVLKQFFNMRSGAELSVTALLDGMKLANDMKYRADAEALKRQIATAGTDAEREGLQARLESLNKNILNDVLRVEW